MVTMFLANSTGLADKEYFFWANNDASTTGTVTTLLPASLDTRIAREWKIEDNSAIGEVQISVDMSKTAIYNVGSNFTLLVSAVAGDYSSATLYTGRINIGGTIEFGSVDFADAAYFTVAITDTVPSIGAVESVQKISLTEGWTNASIYLKAGDRFGAGVTSIGDLDGDGVDDLAVGASYDDDGDTNVGAVYILFMNTDGTVKSESKISSTT